MSGLLGVPNVGLHVSDADRSLAFYVDLLGFEVVRDSGWIDDEIVLGMTATPMPLRIVNIRAARGAAVSIVQGRDVVATPLPEHFHTPGAMHLALDVDDLAAMVTTLAAAGVTTVGPTGDVAATGAGPALIAFVRDPDGFFVQLLQRSDPEST